MNSAYNATKYETSYGLSTKGIIILIIVVLIVLAGVGFIIWKLYKEGKIGKKKEVLNITNNENSIGDIEDVSSDQEINVEEQSQNINQNVTDKVMSDESNSDEYVAPNFNTDYNQNNNFNQFNNSSINNTFDNQIQSQNISQTAPNLYGNNMDTTQNNVAPSFDNGPIVAEPNGFNNQVVNEQPQSNIVQPEVQIGNETHTSLWSNNGNNGNGGIQ